MSTDLVRHSTSYSRMGLQQRTAYAHTISGAADMIPAGLNDKATGRPSPAKIFLVLETGSMLGLDPMAALQGIDVIEGRATIAPRLMLALIRAAGYRVKITERGTVEGGDFGVHVKAWDPADPEDSEEATFTIAMAARAGLCTYTRDQQTGQWTVKARSTRGNPLPWEMYPEDLTQWRAVSRMGKRGFGHILLGIAYTPEELEAVVGEDGTRADVVDTEAEAATVLRIKALDDRQDLRVLYNELRAADQLTPTIERELDAHLMTVTKDSRPPQAGRPGHTGDPAIDGPQQIDAAPAPDDEPVDGEPEHDEHPPTDRGADEEHDYAEEVPAGSTVTAGGVIVAQVERHEVAEPAPLIPEEELPTAEQEAETARLAALHAPEAPAGDEFDAAALAAHPTLDDATRANIADLARRAAANTGAPRRGFNASAMGGTK